jgi:ubiquinone/menaquinone biosynthesis C-methylase UbiE
MSTNRDVFSQIAPGWYNFRHWSIFRNELEALAERWRGGRLLNLGCAHGPDFLPFRDGFELYGLDFASKMLEFARRYAAKFSLPVNLLISDASYLPFTDRVFDWAIAVATYHHIKGSEDRRLALEELGRVLKPGGEAFITVWNRWQKRFWFKPKEVTVPWRTGDKTLGRYYYLFSYPELERMVRKAGFQVLKSSPEGSYHRPLKFFSRNICLLVRKAR